MNDYECIEHEFLTKQFIENNKEIMFSDIQDNQRRNIEETSDKFRTIRNIGKFILQRIYSNRGIPLPSKKQEGDSSKSDKTRIFESI